MASAFRAPWLGDRSLTGVEWGEPVFYVFEKSPEDVEEASLSCLYLEMQAQKMKSQRASLPGGS